jgi:DnaJ-class molecular chaperone
MRGEDVDAEIALTLEQAHRGVTRTVSLQLDETCPTCGGTGSKDGKTCSTCRGSGAIRRQRSFDVTIPAGVRDGSVIRLAGQGEPGANGAPQGDLFLHVRIQPHRLFDVIGDDDIQVEVPISPWEAALGAKTSVPTLDGDAEMKVPASTQTGKRLRLRGQGLNKRDGGRGDEYVKVKIVIPLKLTAKEKQLFEKLAAESHFNPRDFMEKNSA